MSGSTSRLDEIRFPVQRVDALIETAAVHDLGLDFLLNGAMPSVVRTFKVPDFLIEAARDRLRRQAQRLDPTQPGSSVRSALA